MSKWLKKASPAVFSAALFMLSSVSVSQTQPITFTKVAGAGYRCAQFIDGEPVNIWPSDFQDWNTAANKCLELKLLPEHRFKDMRPYAFGSWRIQFSAAFADSYFGDGGASEPPGTPNPPNTAPTWLSQPAPTAQAGVASSYPLSVFDADGDALTITNEAGCTLPTGVTLDSANREIDFSTGTSAGTTASCVFRVDDGEFNEDTSAFSIVISDVSGLCWANQGSPAYIPYPQNRNGTAGSCPQSEAIGPAQVWGGYSQWPTTDPTIIHVTNRNNSGAGSLRTALEASGCRVIVFDVGGEFAVSSQLDVDFGCVTLNGHAAPGPVVVTIPSGSTTVGLLNVKDADQVLVEGMAFILEAPVTCGNRRALSTRDTADHFMFLNSLVMGGTDQNNIHGRGANYQYVDSLFTNPQGADTCSHNYNFQVLDDNQDGLLLGMIFGQARHRNPLWRSEFGTWFNTYVYNAENIVARVEIKRAEDTDITYQINIADFFYDAGPDENGSPPAIRFGSQSDSVPPAIISSASELSVLRVRLDSGMCADAWDSGCVEIFSNTEANVRDDATDHYPTGAVSTNISSLTAADTRTLMFQNNGPWPNNRWTDLQDIYDGMADGTQTISDSYSYTYPANTSGVYSEGGDPHGDDDMDGIPNLMEQFETERGAMYAN